MFKKQQETDQSKTIILLSLGHFHAQMSLKILEKNMEMCALFLSNDSQNDSQPDINTFHKISSGQMPGTMKSTEI